MCKIICIIKYELVVAMWVNYYIINGVKSYKKYRLNGFSMNSLITMNHGLGIIAFTPLQNV